MLVEIENTPRSTVPLGTECGKNKKFNIEYDERYVFKPIE